ncbi:MAG: PQQ-dependent sugar dehydrogenase, partial [Holophagales bacterium]|nr:PQQ-dependent sugar dehydrogenase [Holophagales bacterium]
LSMRKVFRRTLGARLAWLAGLAFLVGMGAGISSADELDQLALDPLVSGLSDQVFIASAGDERLFLVDKAGVIRIWNGSELLATPFLDIGSLTSFGFEQGLLSMAFHPSYAKNGRFYVFYSDVADEPVIARYEVSAADPNRADPASGVILRTFAHFGGHYGGQLQFGPDGFLYFAIGDGGQQEDPACRAQNLGLYQGKMMRIDVDQSVDTPPYHGIPADNPFVGPGDPPDEVWAIGFRNPWRFSFDRATGDLFIADVGQFVREEVSRQPASSPGGENYGWKVMEGTSCFDPDPLDPDCPVGTPSCFDPGFTPPILEYGHGSGDCSITGGYVYRGVAIPALQGHYLYGDWCSGNLWAARPEGPSWTPRLLAISLPAITTFGEGADGELYLTNGSTVYRLTGPGTLFADGFETGDLDAWSSISPLPIQP